MTMQKPETPPKTTRLTGSAKAWLVYLAWLEVEQCDDAIRQYADAGISGTVHDIEHHQMRDEALKTVKELTEDDQPTANWEDERTQVVYRLLCSDDAPPNMEEHWEGWVARRIVAALIPGSAESHG